MTDALAAVRAHTDAVPEITLILGSGLGALADTVEHPTVIPTGAIPGYPASTVEGHKGQLVIGALEGRAVLFVQGRVHMYEGHSPRATAFPVRLAHALGARSLLVTNAAGGVNASFEPGTLMLITDHLNVASASPLAGPVGAGETRFPDMSAPYDPVWTDRAETLALQQGIAVRRGVYAWVAGPSYETKAEIRMLQRFGADAVGMSTVPEVIQAAALGMRVLGISTITNKAAGLSPTPLNHEEVLATGRQVRDRLAAWVRAIVREG